MEATVRKIVETFGRLDCAFNNAGVVIDEAVNLADYTEDAWDQTINVNLKGVWLGMKYQIPAMLENGGGAIVNHASVMGMVLMNASTAEMASIHAFLVAGLANGALRPVIGKELPLSEAARAHHLIMESPACGKIVLIP